MQLLIILNRKPYDGTDVTWNALRLTKQALEKGMTVKVFLMNDAVDLAREGLGKDDQYDLQAMLIEAISKGLEVKLCQSCLSRCGLGIGKISPKTKVATMPELVDWIAESEQVLTF